MRILFVEDDAMNRRVVRDMLHVVGVSMEEAVDAEAGLQMIENGSFNLVLMDLRMPGMDGMTAIRMIRARTDEKSMLPVIVVTADSAPDLLSRCLENGADDVLTKPVAMSALLEAVGRALSKGHGEEVVVS